MAMSQSGPTAQGEEQGMAGWLGGGKEPDIRKEEIYVSN